MLNNYRIFEADGFLEDLEDILGKRWEHVYVKIKTYIYPQLSQQPYFGKNIKKLKAYSPETWRYRLGDLRLFYQIDSKGKIVIMAAAYLRKDSYR
ncbi:MAG: type II toxin-antitoxin system RelE/ParE family toxin [Candidatus Omnitrophica bacterium]|nr:type II toxin-antitoxin system RelE/ParE family toxin [Candidatus Omnitrophota bacterium]